MKYKIYIVISAVTLIFVLINQNVQAQQNIAQQVYAIFEQSCLICHGENGSYRESLIIEHTALINDGKVVPGDPGGSVLYQRLIETNPAKRMPQGQPQLAPEAIETIRQWIAAGAPDWDATPRPKPSFITTDAIVETIENHVNSLSARDKSFARYFTMTHLYNAGETTETLNAYRRALSKLINSLSWGREVVNPKPIDTEQTIFYIDLRDYEWDVRNDAWAQIEQAYPYQMAFDAPTQKELLEKLTTLQQEMSCEVPFVHVDWFLATASLPPLYHDILALPETDRELEASLEVYVAENLLNAPGKRVWRAGFNDSGVSQHNRVVERHISRYGAYWKSYDFAGSADEQNIFAHPLDFSQDGGEIIFNLPNGLQAYLIVDANGIRIDAAPISIVRNPATSDPTVRNGLSCIGCHTEGMKTFEDKVRAAVKKATNPPYDKVKALDLYVQKTVMDALVTEDTQRFRGALEKTGGVFGGIEPVQRFHETFQGTLSAAHAAAAVGLQTQDFVQKILRNERLQSLGLLVLTDENGNIKRDAWTSNFHDVISALNSLDSVLQPPEPIPGASVHIPDANLRTAIEEALGKAAGEVITVEDMETLTTLHAIGMGIRDITGIEYAINLNVLQIGDNMITDISLIAGLTELTGLRVSGNKISDISPITDLKNIGSLEIYANEITDISPLAGLKLHWLSMYNNPVTDISPLANMKSLKGMRVSVKEGGDLSPLAELTNLEVLYYWNRGERGEPVPDLTPLTKLPKLKVVDIRGVGEVDLSPLVSLKGIKELWLADLDISDLSFLQNLTTLERLNLEGNNISDVSPLAGLTNLKWLKLTNNPITDFSPLAELAQTTNIITGEVAIPDPTLRSAIAATLGKDANDIFVSITVEEMATIKELHMKGKNVRNLTGIEFATNLQKIDFFPESTEDKGFLSDLSPLAGLTKLKWLRLSGKSITDLSQLAGLMNLEHLGLFVTDVSDLSPLANLPKLKTLWFNHAPVSDISPLGSVTSLENLEFYYAENPSLEPLKGLSQLKKLSAARSEISDISPLTELVNLEELDLFDNRHISDISALASLHKLRRLNLLQNDISDISALASLHNLEWLHIAHNKVSDISLLDNLPKNPKIIWYENPGFPVGGPKIEGPWLWTRVPGPYLDDSTDFLSQASGGNVTELQIATNGAAGGESVGESTWTAHKISASIENNIGEMIDALGWTSGEDMSRYILYGSIKLNSPGEQQTKLFVGASDNVRAWINGELVHKKFGRSWWEPYTINYQHIIPVTLNKGVNVLLVAIDNRSPNWNGFFGFEPGTEYTVPSVGYTISETDIRVGDTFTLHFNAENFIDLAGWQADIAFDPHALEAVEVTEGDFLKSEGGDTFFQGGTIDNTAGKITSLYSARIAESGVSGIGTLLSVTFKAKAGGETQVTLENFEFSSITGDIIPAVPPNITITVGEYPAWDVNQDGRVSIIDLVLVAKDFGSNTSANLRTDVNRDGTINIQDLILVAQHIGESTDSTAAPTIYGDELTPTIVQTWIKQAQIANDGSIAFQQGIENLQRLLASLIPEKTALLANYPNPFNPETWVPYHLSKSAEVTLTIYTTNGTVVRTLTLGHQPAGIYKTQNRAAHWNGKNEQGELVSSGIYFYTLTAGDFTATRKMLILK